MKRRGKREHSKNMDLNHKGVGSRCTGMLTFFNNIPPAISESTQTESRTVEQETTEFPIPNDTEKGTVEDIENDENGESKEEIQASFASKIDQTIPESSEENISNKTSMESQEILAISEGLEALTELEITESTKDIKDEKNIDSKDEIQASVSSKIGQTMPKSSEEHIFNKLSMESQKKSISEGQEALTELEITESTKSIKNDENIDFEDEIQASFASRIDQTMPETFEENITIKISMESQQMFPASIGPATAASVLEMHGVQLSRPQEQPSSISRPTERLLAQEIEKLASFRWQNPRQTTDVTNLPRMPSMVGVRQQAPNSFGHYMVQGTAGVQVMGMQGVGGSGFQATSMYPYPGQIFPRVPVASNRNMQGQQPLYSSNPGPAYQQLVCAMYNQLQSYQSHRGQQNQSFYPPCQPVFIRQHFHGNAPRPMPPPPGYFQVRQSHQTNFSPPGGRVVGGAAPHIGNPLLGGQNDPIVREGDIHEPLQPPQPPSLMSLRLGPMEMNKGHGSQDLSESSAKSRSQRSRTLVDIIDPRTGENILDQIYNNYEQGTLTPQNRSAEMIAESADHIQNSMNNDSESDSTANDNQERSMDDDAEQMRKDSPGFLKNSQSGPQPDEFTREEDQSSLLNKSGKTVYDRDFLLSLRSNPESRIKPLNLPNLNIILEEISAGDNREDETKSNATEEEDVTAEASYVILRDKLKKLKKQTVDSLVDYVNAMKIDSLEKLHGIVTLVLREVIRKPSSSRMCALMCDKLAELQISNPNGETVSEKRQITFRKLLTIRCRKTLKEVANEHWILKKKLRKTMQMEKPKDISQKSTVEERKICFELFNKIRFMGELYKEKFLDANIIHRCIKILLEQINDESLICFCRLLSTVGEKLNLEEKSLDPYFEQIENIVDHAVPPEVSRNVRIMMQDLIELKKSGWLLKRRSGSTETVDQIGTKNVGLPTAEDVCSQLVKDELQYIGDTLEPNNEIKMEFAFEDCQGSPSSSSVQLSMKQIHEQLLDLMSNEKKNSLDEIFSWISENVNERANNPGFIKVLMTAILEVSIESYNNTWRFRVDKFQNLQALIPRYIDANIKLSELQCLIANQEYIHQLDHPQRVLLEILEKQMYESILSFDVYHVWESDRDRTPLTKKSAAMLAVKTFFASLREKNRGSNLDKA